MTLEQCQNMLVQIATRSASFILDILEQSNPMPDTPQPPRPGVPSWCTCTRCRDMPTEEEKVCCRKTPENCTTLLPDFHVLCLDEAVLALARLYREDVLALPADENYNRANRHAAYRQFILWTYGKLGAGQRKVIPSCVVWKIRDKYPEPSGQYVGFHPGRLA
ncbi:P2X purinoceptor 7-like [Magallana gigas]|uniref:P2X purinoceptor 7-like n=2 Tax=Magallana TaxID=2171616 RepID=UPI0033425664